MTDLHTIFVVDPCPDGDPDRILTLTCHTCGKSMRASDVDSHAPLAHRTSAISVFMSEASLQRYLALEERVQKIKELSREHPH